MSTLIQTTLHAQRAQASSKGVMVVPPPSSGLWACGQAKGCPSGAPATRMSTAPTGALGWTPAGTVCWDGDGPGWSGGWRATLRLRKVPPAPSLVLLIAASGPATDDPVEGSGPPRCDRGRSQQVTGTRSRPPRPGALAVAP